MKKPLENVAFPGVAESGSVRRRGVEKVAVSQGNTRIPEIRTTPRTTSPSKTGHSDRLSDLREWFAEAARETVQDVVLRNELVGLLNRMNGDQLTVARANLIQILDADQVSSSNRDSVG